MNRKIMQMQIEETALKKETDHLSQERLADLQKNLQNCVMSLIPEKRSGAPKRMQLTMSARSESRLRAQRRRSRQHSVTQIMKKLRNCSTVNCLDYRKNWKLRKINSKTVICLWYTKMSPMKRLQRSFPLDGNPGCEVKRKRAEQDTAPG